MRMIEEQTIVTNPDILSEYYVPANIPAREPQIQEPTFCLSPALKKKKLIHAWEVALHKKYLVSFSATWQTYPFPSLFIL